MKSLQTFLLLFLSGILFSCSKSGGGSDPVPATQADIAAVDSKVNTFMTTYNVPGASLAVSKNGKLVYVKGYGKANTSTNELVTPAHRFRLASVSKTFTGVAILKLVQDGRLSLDAKVFGTGGVLANDFGTSPYNSNLLNITVRHLLQNVSGSWGASTGGDVIDQNPSYTYKQLLDWIINTRPNPNVPGTVYDYSNVNFCIAGRIIEKISGKSYVNFIKEDIMAPIGATQTDISGKTAGEKKANEVTYYGQGQDANFVYNIAFPRRDADGGLLSTASDLLRLVNAIDGFSTRTDLLTPASITALTTPSAVFSSYACGIGIWSAENLWYNYGSLPGTRTGFFRHNNGMCVALLLNSRVDPVAGENPFVFAMQDLMLDLVKNSSYTWQNIDQF
ncbi:MAG TPA: serine hydrolase domain-containing protein [Chitinophagaceae bacterium]|nr:serine hydrolase domain-containing protein [Chitinophagaceae bacterium]HPH31851.1 serine hydrolase domain-containing protein [Chitinophagaceae bacterium]HPN57856.1 serine hydrolase domain-containing protein [Chitinophagaceae bacterium]